MKKILLALVSLLLIFYVTACGAADAPQDSGEADGNFASEDGGKSSSPAQSDDGSELATDEKTDETEMETMKTNVTIGGASFTATLEDNEAVHELIKMMEKAPVSVEMSDYSGFEKVGALGRSLPTDDRRTTTGAGDIVLYNGSNIVMFYGSNTWSYTMIGHIDDLTGWEDALGGGSITAVFTLSK